ncbi:MAG: dihydrolipoyllysine-residue acetyltransferase [Gammaproteobacteria bacterium]|nr:dihydrolipoyllysine-residue acetyltransferase [Gammaproteobacteria bacterium]
MATAKEVLVPDIGDFENVEVIEVLVAPGDRVKAEDSLISLESDKATMEIPSPHGGVVESVKVKVGDKVSEGALIAVIEAEQGRAEAAGDEDKGRDEGEPEEKTHKDKTRAASDDAEARKSKSSSATTSAPAGSPAPAAPPVPDLTPREVAAAQRGKGHASPAVRHLANELGVDLAQVSGSGRKGRVLKEDVQKFVKNVMTRSGPTGPVGLQMADFSDVDFSEWGEVDHEPLSRIKKLSGPNLHRNWITVPHVTQFDEADITELEDFRQGKKDQLAKEGVRLTLLSFLIKAAVVALKKFPHFNSSLAPSGDELIIKRYFNVGIAVDTPGGLVVPIIRNADQKGLFQLAAELGEASQKARDRKLGPKDMQGGTFTISSLGGIGGTWFTPIINAPEVAILGISKAEMKPVYENGEFVPRLVLPISLSYDHRVIDGSDAARFTTELRTVLSDIRHMLL